MTVAAKLVGFFCYVLFCFEEVEFLERAQEMHLEWYIILMPFKSAHELKNLASFLRLDYSIYYHSCHKRICCFRNLSNRFFKKPLFVPSSKSHSLIQTVWKTTDLSRTFLSRQRSLKKCPLTVSHYLNNMLELHQSAYRTGHSTDTALLKAVNVLLIAVDHGKISILSLLDLSMAFDTIDHKVLLSRLESSYGLCDTVLAWFRSHLIDRSQTVSVNGCYSPSTFLKYGVPQGSGFGTSTVCPIYQACVSCHRSPHFENLMTCVQNK